MERKSPEIHCRKIFIDNTWRESSSGNTYFVKDPTTENVLCEVQESSLNDVDLAVKAAQRALALGSPWRTLDASTRGRLLLNLADLIERDAEYLATLETYNSGRVLRASRNDIKTVVQVSRYFGSLADKIHGKTIPADGDVFSMTRVEPIGVCALILSWNFPLLMLLGKMSAALACGNTVVVKPSQQTPLSSLYLAKLALEVGFPPGVINIVTGSGSLVGKALTEHMDVDMVSFTGSTKVGQIVQEAAGRSNCKRTVLSLSGKSSVVVFPDTDLDKAVAICHKAVFTHQGQICCAGSRTYVHEDIYNEFIQKSKDLIQKIVIGDPLKEDTTQGPQIDEKSMSHILTMIQTGIEEGAKLQCGGKRHGEKGFFVEPTLFSDVRDDMLIAREEIFGPVQQVFKFRHIEEVIERSNDSRFGLAAGVLTRDLDTALLYAQGVKSGTVWINCYLNIKPQTPYGGFKMSGFGKELGVDSIIDYTQNKTVTFAVSKKNS